MSFNRRRDRPPRRERDFEQPFSRDAGERRDRPPRPREPWRPAAPPGGGRARPDRFGDEGGMSIRLDPRRLTALKQLAGEAGIRPGELVTRWLEERIDAQRGGGRVQPPAAAGGLEEVVARLDDLAARLRALEKASAGTATAAATQAATPATRPEPDTVEPAAAGAGAEAPRRRGRPRKAPQRPPAAAAERVALHDEIAAVIGERGPSTAAEIAERIVARGRYAPPRSGKPLDAATVNSRVSNPVYRSRFSRRDGRIALTEEG